MTYNDVFKRTLLLSDLSQIKLPASILSDIILLKVHYKGKMTKCWEAQQAINEENADDDAKKAALEKLAQEDAGECRLLPASVFREIVAAADGKESISTMIFADDDGKPREIPTEIWLTLFAENLVEI